MRDFMCKFGATAAILAIIASAPAVIGLFLHLVGRVGCFVGLGIFPEGNVIGSEAVSCAYVMTGAIMGIVAFGSAVIGLLLYFIFEDLWTDIYRNCRDHWSGGKGS